ncbi:MAG: hypothetical protein AB7D06_08830 [Pedobacter sp.]
MKLKRLFRPLYWLVMRCTGTIYLEPGLRVTTSGWVIISDGKSKDALPISLVSQEIVDKVEASLASWGYT